MTTFDLVLTSLILVGGIWGLVAGASRISVSFVLVLVVASMLYSYPRIAALFQGPDLAVKVFLCILIFVISLVIFGVASRIIRNAITTAGLGPLDKILGLALGLATGILLAGSLIWGIETYGDGKWQRLLNDSQISPPALTFFRHIMAFTDRIFPQPEKPWWQRPLW